MFWNPPSSRGLSLFCFEKLIKTKISHSSNKSKDCGSCPFTSYFRLILVMYRVALFRAQQSGDFSQGLFIILDQGGHKALDCYKFNFIFERIKNVVKAKSCLGSWKLCLFGHLCVIKLRISLAEIIFISYSMWLYGFVKNTAKQNLSAVQMLNVANTWDCYNFWGR